MKRYPPRKPKDYRWCANRSEGTLPAATVLTDGLQPANNVITGSRQTVNIQRLLLDVTWSIDSAALLDIATALFTRVSWLLLLVDNEDNTAYDPESATNLEDEVVLAHGETEYFGYGTTQSLLAAGSGVVLAQTAVCMAYARAHIDLKSNRKLEVNNQKLGLYTSRPAFNEINQDDIDLKQEATWRMLIKVP